MNSATLVNRSFENLVDFYKVELIKILDGVEAKTLLGRYERRRLRRDGVLHPSGFGPRCVWLVSNKAQAVLDDSVTRVTNRSIERARARFPPSSRPS